MFEMQFEVDRYLGVGGFLQVGVGLFVLFLVWGRWCLFLEVYYSEWMKLKVEGLEIFLFFVYLKEFRENYIVFDFCFLF